MSKRRKLSPTASSRSSATPAPSIPSQAAAAEGVVADTPSSPIPSDGISAAGPSRGGLSTSGTPVPFAAGDDDIKEARTGPVVPGSGDGGELGEECFLWADLPMNKTGYRYLPCSLSPTPSPSRYVPFYRTLPGPPACPPVHLSWTDRSYFLRMSPTATTITTDRGYRSARANVPVRQGTWYYEVQIVRGDGAQGGGGGTAGDVGNAHVRLGWGRREANLDAPVGMDAYGYGIRDVNGEKVHISRPKAYAGKSFKTGDIVGCLISLPERVENLDKMKRKRTPIKYKGMRWFEMMEYGVQKEMENLVDREGKIAAAAAKAATEAAQGVKDESAGPSKSKKGKKAKAAQDEEDLTVGGSMNRHLPILKGSKVEFFLNGQSLGTAFEDIYDFSPLPPIPHGPSVAHGAKKEKDHTIYDDWTLGYYPMVSCFGKAKVKCNFGPDWRYDPPSSIGVRAMSERWDEYRETELMLDERDEALDAIRIKKEEEEWERKRKKAEERVGVKKASAAARKKRKGTDTPAGTPGPDERKATGSVIGTEDARGTPGLDEVKQESGANSPVKRSRAGTEEIVKKEEAEFDEPVEERLRQEDPVTHHETPIGGNDVSQEEDANEGVNWDT